MTEKSWPWPEIGPGDGMAYTDAEWRSMWRATFATEGILRGFLNELAVTIIGANDLQVDTGAAYVDGGYYQNITAHIHLAPASAPAGETRKCAVVIEQDHNGSGSTGQYTTRMTTKVGTAGAYPAMTQVSETRWQMLHYYYTIDDAGTISGLTKMSDYAHFRDQITQGMLVSGILTANAAGRALMQAGYFDAATILDKIGAGAFTTANVLDKFAAGSFTTANLLSLIPVDAVTNAVLLQIVKDGAFQADAASRALFANGMWTNGKHALGARFIKGMVMPFSGSFAGHFPNDPDTGAPDTSWHLCNGDVENGVTTPNLADRMVIAAGATYAAGATGGAATKDLAHTHTQGATGSTALSNHAHSINLLTSAEVSPGNCVAGGANPVVGTHDHVVAGDTGNPTTNPTHTHTNPTTASGGSSTQDIMPPYYALAYICYVGTP